MAGNVKGNINYLNFFKTGGQTNPVLDTAAGTSKVASSLPKAARGWKASEMETWSESKKKEVFSKYGKEGLTPNTYAYLARRVGNTQESTKSKRVLTNDDVKLVQKSLGYTGSAVDGLYGSDTIRDMKKKYGNVDIFTIVDQLSKENSPVKGTAQAPASKTHSAAQSQEQKSSTTQLQKGKDWSGSNSYTEERLAANKANSTNKQQSTTTRPPIVVDTKYLQTLNQIPSLSNDAIPAVSGDSLEEKDLLQKMSSAAKSGNEEEQSRASEQYITIQNEKKAKQEKDESAKFDEKYGKGNWGYDSNHNLIIREKAPGYSESVFAVPEEWDTFISDNQKKPFGFDIQNNALASKVFGNSTGFHTGNTFLGVHDSVPLYLSDEDTLEDAYAKAYAAGNRSFTYKGKTYNTTSYSDKAAKYLQAIYDSDFEKKLNGDISAETKERLNKAKAAWGNDELQRFGINNYALRGSSSSGYPLVGAYNIADNVGLYGYSNGVSRMINASKGYQDLGTNNKGNQTNVGFFKLFETAEQDRKERQYSADRAALMKLGVGMPLAPDSKELSSIYIDPNIQPVSFENQPVEYSFSVKGNPGTFKPNGDASGQWEYKGQTGNYVRSGIQQGGTMWNASQVYIPGKDMTILYDVNDYMLSPNGAIGWNGYTPIPVTALSFGKPKIEQTASDTAKKQQGGFLNYLQYFKNGGINIKKANKGKFTEYCDGKVTEECIEKGKHSTSVAVRKRAVFAENIRKWKH